MTPTNQPRSRAHQRPPLRIFTTTLWEYPSQHYDAWVEDGKVHKSGAHGPAPDSSRARNMQGERDYAGATPAWIVWQLLMRYTRENDLVIDPMVGSGTTLDVARDLRRRAIGYDLSPTRSDVFRADARRLPLEDAKADFVFIDPPYSTHIEYSDDPACIGSLDAGGPDAGRAYYQAMDAVFAEAWRVMRDRRYMGVYVSDSWRKRRRDGETKRQRQDNEPEVRAMDARHHAPARGTGEFMPIGFELFSLLRERFKPIDIVCVVRQNAKLKRGNWHKAAEEGNYFLRGFNYLFIMKKEGQEKPASRPRAAPRTPPPADD